MTLKILRLILKSATIFGRGDGVAGWVDREIEHDVDGFPYLRGKTLKGLMAESAENVVYALNEQGKPGWQKVKDDLFGKPGRGINERGKLHVGDAQLPESLRSVVLIEREKGGGHPDKNEVLYSLTGIRRQTAMNPDGGPDSHTLRSMRVLLRGVALEAPLSFSADLTEQEKALLVSAVLDLRRAGTGRNRGRGWVQAELDDEKTTRALFKQFTQAVTL